MSESDRDRDLKIGGVGGGLLAVWLVFSIASCVNYKSEHRREDRYAAAQYAKQSAKEGETLCVEIPGKKARACTTQPSGPAPDAAYTQYDLNAQQDMAEWAYAMFLATVAGLIVTAVGLIYVVLAFRKNVEATNATKDAADAAKASADTAKESTGISRQMLEDVERPFLFAEPEQDLPLFDKINKLIDKQPPIDVTKKKSFPFDPKTTTYLSFANHGRSPALIDRYYAKRVERWASSGLPEPIDAETSPSYLMPHGVIVTTTKPGNKNEVVDFFFADPDDMRGASDITRWYLIGFAVYRATTGMYFAAGFCFEYITEDGKWYIVPGYGEHDSYNYDKKIPPSPPPTHDDEPDLFDPPLYDPDPAF